MDNILAVEQKVLGVMFKNYRRRPRHDNPVIWIPGGAAGLAKAAWAPTWNGMNTLATRRQALRTLAGSLTCPLGLCAMGTVWQTVLSALFPPPLRAAAACDTPGQFQGDAMFQEDTTPATPPIDTRQPPELATATFAMG